MKRSELFGRPRSRSPFFGGQPAAPSTAVEAPEATRQPKNGPSAGTGREFMVTTDAVPEAHALIRESYDRLNSVMLSAGLGWSIETRSGELRYSDIHNVLVAARVWLQSPESDPT